MNCSRAASVAPTAVPSVYHSDEPGDAKNRLTWVMVGREKTALTLEITPANFNSMESSLRSRPIQKDSLGGRINGWPA